MGRPGDDEMDDDGAVGRDDSVRFVIDLDFFLLKLLGVTSDFSLPERGSGVLDLPIASGLSFSCFMKLAGNPMRSSIFV